MPGNPFSFFGVGQVVQEVRRITQDQVKLSLRHIIFNGDRLGRQALAEYRVAKILPGSFRGFFIDLYGMDAGIRETLGHH
ncbi:hypothetical protein D9M68_838760 [compost metagenome]